jgi:uncharacterized MnhB-related membrane protein
VIVVGVPVSCGASLYAFRSAADRAFALAALGHSVFQVLALLALVAAALM